MPPTKSNGTRNVTVIAAAILTAGVAVALALGGWQRDHESEQQSWLKANTKAISANAERLATCEATMHAIQRGVDSLQVGQTEMNRKLDRALTGRNP